MTWATLLANKSVTAIPPTKEELDNLRSIVARSLKDVTAPGLSADSRFIMAYDAARTMSLIIVRASGYRPRSFGAHYITFLALESADPIFVPMSAVAHTTADIARKALRIPRIPRIPRIREAGDIIDPKKRIDGAPRPK